MLRFVLHCSKTNDSQRKVKLYDAFFPNFFLRRLWFVLNRYFFSMLCVSISENWLFSGFFFTFFHFCEIVHFNLSRNKLLIRMLRFHMTKYSYYSMRANSENVFMVKGQLPLISYK